MDPDALQLPANLPEVLPRQPQPGPGNPVGYTRMAVMDGKTLKHKVYIVYHFAGTGLDIGLPEMRT
jgi:hypothetical protein